MNWTDFIIAIKQGLIPSKKELVDGTTTVGNANKLGDKSASEYLTKSGGTISTVGAAPLSVKNSGGNDVFISFSNQSKSLGMLGFMGDSTPRYYTSNWASAYTLLHEGNVGDYALVKNGGGTITKGYRTVIALNNSDGASSSVLFESYGASLGELGVSNTGATEVPFFKEKNNGTTRILLHEGNVADYALPKSGGKAENGFTVSGGTVPLWVQNTNPNTSETLIEFNKNTNGTMSYLGALGFDTVNRPAYYKAGVGSYPLLHSGNVGDYAVKKSDITSQTITAPIFTPLIIDNTHASSTGLMMTFKLRGEEQGSIGFNGGELRTMIEGVQRVIHHDGNSAKVAIQSTAPTDTSALWVW